MDKSNSLDKLTVEQLVDQAVDYLRHWGQAELSAMISNTKDKGKAPLIARIGNKGYVVGNYAVLPIGDNGWRACYRFSDFDHVFTSKLSAICYAVCQQMDKIMLADRILKQDADVSRLSVKADQFYFRLQQALKKKNSLKTDLFLVRYEETTNRLNESKSQLEKSLKSAKYFKF
jgi:hypothetical protein